jgi:hypothetical protein
MASTPTIFIAIRVLDIFICDHNNQNRFSDKRALRDFVREERRRDDKLSAMTSVPDYATVFAEYFSQCPKINALAENLPAAAMNI